MKQSKCPKIISGVHIFQSIPSVHNILNYDGTYEIRLSKCIGCGLIDDTGRLKPKT